MAKKWIQKTHLEKGSFTKSAKSAGESVHEHAEKEKGASGKEGKRARLALVFEKMAGRRKKLYNHERSKRHHGD